MIEELDQLVGDDKEEEDADEDMKVSNSSSLIFVMIVGESFCTDPSACHLDLYTYIWTCVYLF